MVLGVWQEGWDGAEGRKGTLPREPSGRDWVGSGVVPHSFNPPGSHTRGRCQLIFIDKEPKLEPTVWSLFSPGPMEPDQPLGVLASVPAWPYIRSGHFWGPRGPLRIQWESAGAWLRAEPQCCAPSVALTLPPLWRCLHVPVRPSPAAAPSPSSPAQGPCAFRPSLAGQAGLWHVQDSESKGMPPSYNPPQLSWRGKAWDTHAKGP